MCFTHLTHIYTVVPFSFLVTPSRDPINNFESLSYPHAWGFRHNMPVMARKTRLLPPWAERKGLSYARHFSGAMFRGSCLLSNEEFLVPLPATSIRLCSSAGFWFLCLHLDWSASCIQTHFVLVLQVCTSESTTKLFGTGFFNTAALGVCQLCGFSSPVPRTDPFPSTWGRSRRKRYVRYCSTKQ